MTNDCAAPETPTSLLQIGEGLIIELIGLLKNVIENSGTGRTAQQMQDLILALSAVHREVVKLNKSLDASNNLEAALQALEGKIDAQSAHITEIGLKVSQMYPVLFEADTQNA